MSAFSFVLQRNQNFNCLSKAGFPFFAWHSSILCPLFLPVPEDGLTILKLFRMVFIITISLNTLCPQELRMTINVANSELHNSGLQTVPYLLLKKRKCKLALLMQYDLLEDINWEEEGPFTVRLSMTMSFVI